MSGWFVYPDVKDEEWKMGYGTGPAGGPAHTGTPVPHNLIAMGYFFLFQNDVEARELTVTNVTAAITSQQGRNRVHTSA